MIYLIVVCCTLVALFAGYAIAAMQFEVKIDDLYETIFELENDLAFSELQVEVMKQRPYSMNGKCGDSCND